VRQRSRQWFAHASEGGENRGPRRILFVIFNLLLNVQHIGLHRLQHRAAQVIASSYEGVWSASAG
jgi:hypothetical protein